LSKESTILYIFLIKRERERETERERERERERIASGTYSKNPKEIINYFYIYEN
jgi:hypothetical protein